MKPTLKFTRNFRRYFTLKTQCGGVTSEIQTVRTTENIGDRVKTAYTAVITSNNVNEIVWNSKMY